MADLESAFEHYSKNKYEEAFLLLNECISTNELSSEELIRSLKLFFEVRKLLKTKNLYSDYRVLLAQQYYQKGDYENALIEYQYALIENEKKYMTHLEQVWDCYFQVGQIENSDNTAEKYIDHLLAKKSTGKLRRFISIAKKNRNQSIDWDLSLVLANLSTGLEEGVKEYLLTHFTLSSIINPNKKNYEKIIKLSNAVQGHQYWNRHWVKKWIDLVEIVIRMNIENGANTYSNAKSFVTLIFEFVLAGGDLTIALSYLGVYSSRFRRKKLARHYLNHSSPKKNEVNSIYRNIQIEIENYDSNLNLSNEADYGSDLLKEEVFGLNKNKARIRQLVFEINLLEKNNQHEKVSRLYTELASLDPDHFKVVEYNEKINLGHGSKLLARRESAQEISEKLQNEIRKFSKENSQPETDESYKRVLKKTITLMSEKEIEDNGEDLLVSLIEFGFEDIGEWLLTTYIKLFNLTRVEFDYYKIVCFMGMEKFAQAAELAEDILTTEQLNEETHICFSYLRAECFRSLGKKMDALRIYQEIYKRNPRYRLVSQRLSEVA